MPKGCPGPSNVPDFASLSARRSAKRSTAAWNAPPSLCCVSSRMTSGAAFAAGEVERVEKRIWRFKSAVNA